MLRCRPSRGMHFPGEHSPGRGVKNLFFCCCLCDSWGKSIIIVAAGPQNIIFDIFCEKKIHGIEYYR